MGRSKEWSTLNARRNTEYLSDLTRSFTNRARVWHHRLGLEAASQHLPRPNRCPIRRQARSQQRGASRPTHTPVWVGGAWTAVGGPATAQEREHSIAIHVRTLVGLSCSQIACYYQWRCLLYYCIYSRSIIIIHVRFFFLFCWEGMLYICYIQLTDIALF